MYRFFASLVLATLVASASAAALCTDTLYISRLRQFNLTFRNVRTNAWDSTEISVRQLSDARALSLSPRVDTSEIVFPVQFQSNCGLDSVDEVSFLRLRDVGYTQRGTDSWKAVNDIVKLSDVVTSYGPATLNQVTVKGFWEIDGGSKKIYQVARLGDAAPSAYHIQLQSFRYMAGNGSYIYSSLIPYTSPLRSSAFDDVNKYLTALQPALDSVGHGLDSVRVSARVFESTYSYDTTGWSLASTSVGVRAPRGPGFTSYRTSRGFVFVLPHPVSLTILSSSGRVVRNLPASSAPLWDGTDLSGRRVPHGVYLVRGMGLGVIPILAP